MKSGSINPSTIFNNNFFVNFLYVFVFGLYILGFKSFFFLGFWHMTLSYLVLFISWIIVKHQSLLHKHLMFVLLAFPLILFSTVISCARHSQNEVAMSSILLDGHIEEIEVYDSEEKETYIMDSFVADGEKGQLHSKIIGWLLILISLLPLYLMIKVQKRLPKGYADVREAISPFTGRPAGHY